MTVHDTVHGFIVEREVPLPELDAVMYQMKHEKTGLELVWISREEENKALNLSFHASSGTSLHLAQEAILLFRLQIHARYHVMSQISSLLSNRRLIII